MMKMKQEHYKLVQARDRVKIAREQVADAKEAKDCAAMDCAATYSRAKDAWQSAREELADARELLVMARDADKIEREIEQERAAERV